MKVPCIISYTQGVVTRFLLAMTFVGQHQKRLIKKICSASD